MDKMEKQLQLFNFLTNTRETFISWDSSVVKLYVCGPTVYDQPHLGHARTYIFADCLQRILIHHLNYIVHMVMNITDLDDKIIEKGGLKIAKKYEKIFFETMNKLNVTKPTFTPRVTEHLLFMSNFVLKGLKDYIYFSNDDILLDSRKCLDRKRVFPNLENRDNNLEIEEGKKNPKDFVLWKSKHWIDDNGIECYNMPGWHLECAALAAKYFGNYVDIHLGGIDLMFPHHENEITLGRIYFNNDQWVRFCLYTGHLQISGEKMSKSLKNFTTIDDLISKGYSPLAIRYMFLKHPYAKPMEFNEKEMIWAQKSYDEFIQRLIKIKMYLREAKNTENSELFMFTHLQKKINDALLDNLNIPLALKALEDYVKYLSTHMNGLSKLWLQYCFSYILWVTDKYFGLIDSDMYDEKQNDVDQLFLIIKDFRKKVRNFALFHQNGKQTTLLEMCDRVRKDLKDLKYVIED